MKNILRAWKIGQKLNYSEFKRINLAGPTEQVIKRRPATQDSQEQRHASESALKMLKTQLTHNLAIKQPLCMAGTICITG